MAKTTERLSALKVANLKGPGYFADGGNLYFPDYAWRYTRLDLPVHDQRPHARHGAWVPIPKSALPQLAKPPRSYRELVKRGVDPIEQRRTDRAAHRAGRSPDADASTNARGTTSPITKAAGATPSTGTNGVNTIARYASPVFGKLPVAAIDESLVLRALKPIWYDKPETASRVRGRIESILDWARVHGYRSGENPARWKGHLAAFASGRFQSAAGQAPRRPALPAIGAVHGGAARAPGWRRARPGICHPDCGTHRRGVGRDLGRNRLGQQGLDCARPNG